MPVFENAPRNWPTTTIGADYVTLTISRTYETYTTTILLGVGQTIAPDNPTIPAAAIKDDGLSALTVGIIVASIIGFLVVLILLFCCCYLPRRRQRQNYSSTYYSSSYTGSDISSSLPSAAAVRQETTDTRTTRMTRGPLRPRAPIIVGPPPLRPLQAPTRAYTRGFFRRPEL